MSFASDSAGTFSGSPCTLSGSGSSSSCSVTYTPSAVGSGTHTITATYGGDSTHNGSAGSTTVSVTKRSTSTSVSCSPGTVLVGSSTTCTATVTDTAAGTKTTPSGTVTFTSDSAGTFSGGGSFTDPNTGQSWNATINWGDGSATAPLTLNADKTFNLSHAYPNPGTYTATVAVNDNVGGSGSDTVIISVTPSARLGSSGDDVYMIRIDPANPSMIQFFENRTVAQGPSYSIAYAAMSNYTFNAVGGNDQLIVDTTYGNPIPSGGVSYNGGAQTFDGADLIQVIGGDVNDAVTIRASQVQVGSSIITYGSVEMIRVDGNGGDDTLTISNSLTFTPIYNAGVGNNSLVLNAGEYDYSQDASTTSSNL